MPDPAPPEMVFAFDVESIGLFGEAFAVAGGLYLRAGGAAFEFCHACAPGRCRGGDDDRAWVAANVPPIETTHPDPEAVRQAFWQGWTRAREAGAIMVAHCLWPVEAAFLAACILDAPTERKWQGPYPFYDLSSLLLACNTDPTADLPRRPEELPKHSPLADARQCARLFFESLDRIRPA